MPCYDSSSSKAIVSGGFGDSTAMATATTGRLLFPMLIRTNYVAWAIRMKFLLRTNGAWGAINPEKTSGAVDESKDQLALMIISQLIDDETLLRVAEKETTSDSVGVQQVILNSVHGVEVVKQNDHAESAILVAMDFYRPQRRRAKGENLHQLVLAHGDVAHLAVVRPEAAKLPGAAEETPHVRSYLLPSPSNTGTSIPCWPSLPSPITQSSSPSVKASVMCRAAMEPLARPQAAE
uniref:DUF4219 domain-containing protein n=1 Tax=Oryza punctata TaxID=4537 RepID=A0A0E0LJU5_ORYPU